jgi:hypothetical protein
MAMLRSYLIDDQIKRGSMQALFHPHYPTCGADVAVEAVGGDLIRIAKWDSTRVSCAGLINSRCADGYW